MSATILQRNRYFFGKMMDVAQFEKEQIYFRTQLALLNRLVIGTGVVCGLEVTPDASVKGNVSISAGVAIDGLGRFVIVPAPVSVSPAQLTDDLGKPQGSPLTSGTTLISLCFAETCADPVSVFATGCDSPGDCAASTIVEAYRIIVQMAPSTTPPVPTCTIKGFAKMADKELQKTLAEIVGAKCPDPGAACVPLARVDLPGTIDAVSDRPLVYGNRLLLQMALCLKSSI